MFSQHIINTIQYHQSIKTYVKRVALLMFMRTTYNGDDGAFLNEGNYF
ncbi:hypothetical protein [Paenalkalicoccus suaedae]|nr:hypothetical protein [Paenalkalicoccus suaedae]